MTIDEAVTTYLLQQSELTNLIDDKIFPDIIPKESKLPGIAYTIEYNNEDIVMTGHDGDCQTSIEFQVESLTKSMAVTIGETLRKIFRTLKKSNDFNGYKLQLVKYDGRFGSDYSNDKYIEIYSFTFHHDYIEI